MADLHDSSRRRVLGASIWLGAAAAFPLAARVRSGAALASTRSGRIRGANDRGIHVFKGVPYGADTTARRFMPALPEQPWTGVREALAHGASAPQSGSDGPGSEDCLFLNVFTPGLRDGGKRPILFYIHGGGYNNGSGSSPLYDGVNLCRRGDVVVVTVNHRLNVFGYLYLAELGGEDLQWSGNVG
jgi:para-nitrobenzyl esterase